MEALYRLHCDCGAVALRLRGRPRGSVYCHCRSCRLLYGVPLLSASVWPASALRREVAHNVSLIAHRLPGRRIWRYHCAACGRLVHGRNRHGDIVIPSERFRALYGDTLPAVLQPTAHCFYEQRVVDIADDLPKHGAGTGGAFPAAADD